MLQHNLSRDSSLSNEVKLIIDTSDLLYRNKNSDNTNVNKFSDIVNVTLPNGGIKRVSKVKIDNISEPLIYNITNSNRTYTILADGIEYDYIVSVGTSGRGGSYFALDPFRSVYNNNPDNKAIPNSTMNARYDLLVNKISIEISTAGFDLPSAAPPVLFLALSNLTYGLGFRKVAQFEHVIFGYDSMPEEFIISEELNNNRILINSVDAPNYIEKQVYITVPDATYDIYTLINVLRRQNLIVVLNGGRNNVRATYVNNDNVSLPFEIVNLGSLDSLLDLSGRSKYIVLAEKDYDADYYFSRLIVDYTVLSVVGFTSPIRTFNTYNLSEGKYTITQIIDELNTQRLYNNGVDPPYPEFQFSYSMNTNRVTVVNQRAINGDGDLYEGGIAVAASGLAKLLGTDFDTYQTLANRPPEEQENTISYLFPKAPIINTKFTALNSNFFNIVRETRTIKPITSAFDDAIIYNTVDNSIEVYLSRKTNIETFDIFLTNDRDEILSLRDDNLVISMTFIVS